MIFSALGSPHHALQGYVGARSDLHPVRPNTQFGHEVKSALLRGLETSFCKDCKGECRSNLGEDICEVRS